MKVIKNLRLCTINYPDKNTREWIEITPDGWMSWKCVDNMLYENCEVGASFPVDLEFVKEFFERAGRKLDVSKLPANHKATLLG